MTTSFEPGLLGNYLKDYYKKLFPFKPYTKWLTYGKKPAEYFAKREFAFILEDDVHLRYRSFMTENEFESDLCKIAPHKLDVGAVYNHYPKEHKKHIDFRAAERELVFDIDLTDYDGARTCCKEAKVCNKCWRFIALAVKILDKLLDEHFGFEARMWVFSGRRGVHCWVGDEKARQLNNVQRSAVAEYLSLLSGEKLDINASRRRQGAFIHPMVTLAYQIAMESGIARKMVEEQGWLEDEHLPFIYQNIDDDELRETIKTTFEKLNSVEDRWSYLTIKFDEDEYEKAKLDPERREHVPTQFGSEACPQFFIWFVLWHVYPRLDVNVSTGLNHLLKSPFCIHPKTGNVAVPLDTEKIEEFDVTTAPRIDLLLRQLAEEEANGEMAENRKVLGYKHTDMAEYVENFEAFVELAREEAQAMEEEEASEEASQGLQLGEGDN